MRQLRLPLPIVFAVILIALCARGPCAAAYLSPMPFPALHRGIDSWVGNSTYQLDLLRGWYAGQQAWYIFAGSNDINTNTSAHEGFRALFPKLASAIGHGANLVYVVLNFNQGPVFSSRPGNAEYSALWQVVYVTWKPGVAKRPIISHLALPDASEADFVTTDIVVDEPIVAIGKLSLPWYPAPAGTYRIRQALFVSVRDKYIVLPVWWAYAQDALTRENTLAYVLITDAADAALAALLRCNHAPGLASIDQANTQKFWVFDWTLPPPPPLIQYAIIENLPNYQGNWERLNDNYDFSPIMDLTRLQRTGLPAYVVVRNPTFLRMLIPPAGTLVTPVGDPVRINASVPEYGGDAMP